MATTATATDLGDWPRIDDADLAALQTTPAARRCAVEVHADHLLRRRDASASAAEASATTSADHPVDYAIHGGLSGSNPLPPSAHDPVRAVLRHTHGFEPTGARGQLSAWAWASSRLTWSLAHVLEGADQTWLDVHAIAQNCLDETSRTCGLTFEALPKTADPRTADIRIMVLKDKDYEPFRRNKKILGLGWFPSPTNPAEGRIVLNGSYRWGDGSPSPAAADLEDDEYVTRLTVITQHVLLHEIGHTLGLPHASTDCPSCVMAPVYSAAASSGAWHGEDAERLRALYGAGGAS